MSSSNGNNKRGLRGNDKRSRRNSKSNGKNGNRPRPNGKNGNGKTRKPKTIKEIDKALHDKFYYDIRGPNSRGAEQLSVLVNPSLPIDIDVPANSFVPIIMGVISRAYQRGWTTNTDDDSYPFWAFRYQVEALILAAQGAVPKINNCPLWFNLLVQAVIKTSVRFKAGTISYNMDITTTPDVDFKQVIGPNIFNFVYNMGIKSASNLASLYPIVIPPLAYSESNGFKATQELWLFLQGDDVKNPMHKMVPVNAKNLMTNDISAFAFFENGPGGGKNETGAWFKKVFNEVKPSSPLFSVFQPYSTNAIPPNRAYVKMHLFAGDGIYLGGTLSSGFPVKALRMKTTPVFKYIDFMQFVDLFLRWIRQMIRLRISSDDFTDNIQKNPAYYNDFVKCPLTLQQFSIMLRATLMTVFTDNYKLQGTFPRTATSASDNEFVVFPCGVNTMPIYYTNGMLMPQIIQENALALRSRAVVTNPSNPILIQSALGMYAKDQIDVKSFNVSWTVDEETVTDSIMEVDPSEVPISLIDGAYSSGGTSGFVCINDPAPVQRFNEIWNKWLQGMGNYTRQLNSITADSGVKSLSSVFMTTHWLPISIEDRAVIPTKRSKVRHASVPDELLKPMKAGLQEPFSIYSQRKVIAVSSGYEVFDALWDQFLQYWILPINYIGPSNTLGDTTQYQMMAEFMREPYQLVLGLGSTTFSSIALRNESYAALCVKQIWSQPTSQEAILKKMEEDGDAGILGSMGGAFAGILGRGLTGAAQNILNGLPY